MSAIVDLLIEARNALVADLAAAGNDEIAQHPTLQARARLVDRIDGALTRQGVMTSDDAPPQRGAR